jgi:hypothetical protein
VILSPSFWLLLHGACSIQFGINTSGSTEIQLYPNALSVANIQNRNAQRREREREIKTQSKPRYLDRLVPRLGIAPQAAVWTLRCRCRRLEPLRPPRKTAAITGHRLLRCHPFHRVLTGTKKASRQRQHPTTTTLI